jgi:hypothetical protein
MGNGRITMRNFRFGFLPNVSLSGGWGIFEIGEREAAGGKGMKMKQRRRRV